MAVSKRVRYEVLRRDNHTCRYCGGAAPDVVLTVDHVIPVALGGSDEPSNLVAACRDCNAGKTSTTPDAPLVEDVSSRAVRWASAMRQAAEERRAEYENRKQIEDWFLDIWKGWTVSSYDGEEAPIPLPDSFGQSVRQFMAAGLEPHDIMDLVTVAMESKATARDTWKYFCGCCWKRVRQAQERASEILADEDEPEGIRFVTSELPEDIAATRLIIADQWRAKGFELPMCMCSSRTQFCGDHGCMLQLVALTQGALMGTDELIRNAFLLYPEREEGEQQEGQAEEVFDGA